MNEIEKFKNIVDKIKENNKISHSYLFEIDNLDSKYSLILDFVKLLVCKNVNNFTDLNKCNCNICKMIEKKEYPDLQIIKPDGSVIKKEKLLNLKKEFNNMSMIGGKRVYIIEDAEKLNMSSANAILKFLEEPEDDVIAILITNNRYNIIDTILSRCQILVLKTNDLQIKHEKEIALFLEYINMDNGLFLNYNHIMTSLFIDKNICKEILLELEVIVVNYLNFSYDKSKINKDIYSYFDNYKAIQLINFINILEKEIQKLKFNVNFKIWMDSLFVLIEEMKLNV